MGDMDVGGVEVGGSVAECALAALLDEGVTVDVRPFLDEVIANPAKLAEAHRLLPPVDQARLAALLPECDNGLTENARHPQLAKAVRDVNSIPDAMAACGAIPLPGERARSYQVAQHVLAHAVSDLELPTRPNEYDW